VEVEFPSDAVEFGRDGQGVDGRRHLDPHESTASEKIITAICNDGAQSAVGVIVVDMAGRGYEDTCSARAKS
jgi:hypothetical protein